MRTLQSNVNLPYLIELAQKTSTRRYRLTIVVGSVPAELSHLARSLSQSLQGLYVNPVDRLLTVRKSSGAKGSDPSPMLGVFDQGDVADWIVRLATNERTPFLIFDQIEPLIATFGRSNSIEFFKLTSLIEPRIPTIVFTYLEKQIKDANFPSDRLFDLY